MADNYESDKSPAQIEREIEAQRSRLSSTIDEIQDQLSPGQLIDQVMSMTKANGGEFAKNLGGAITANPLPVALLGASLLWLISGAGQHKPGSSPRPVPMGYRDGDSDAFRDETFAGYRGDHRSPLDRVKSMGSGVVDKVTGVADQLGGTVGETLGQLGSSASQLGGRVSEAADEFGHVFHDVRDQAWRSTSTVTHMLENQPLIAGALAFAAGAALGAVVPRIPQENELMGEAADQLKSAVKEAAEPLVEQGKHLLDEGAQKLGEGRAAIEEGLSGAKDALGKVVGGGSGSSSTSSN